MMEKAVVRERKSRDMSEKIVEPVPVGVRGCLAVEGDGVRFVRGGSRFRLEQGIGSAEALGLKPRDMLVGWLQCYRGWTAQPESLVERWLEAFAPQGKNGRPASEVRGVFRISDFARLNSQEGQALPLVERKALLDRCLEDRDGLQKNPYLVLADEQVELWLASQPAGSRWQVRSAGCREVESGSETFTGGVDGKAQGMRQAAGTTEGLELAAAGGWLDLSAVERRIRRDEQQLREQEKRLSRLAQERDQLVARRVSEERLRQAGERYLGVLRSRGERCIRAIGAGSDVEESLRAFGFLFESEEVDCASLERRTEALEHQLEALYPIEPVARSSGLDLPKPSPPQRWEEFRVGRVKCEESTKRKRRKEESRWREV